VHAHVSRAEQVGCNCKDGIQLDVCASLDCNSSQASGAVCSYICITRWGVQGIGCLGTDPLCSP